MQDFTKEVNHQKEMFFLNILNNYPTQCCLFTDASWLLDTQIDGVGFFLTNAHKKILLTGCAKIVADDPLDAELTALELSLKIAIGFK